MSAHTKVSKVLDFRMTSLEWGAGATAPLFKGTQLLVSMAVVFLGLSVFYLSAIQGCNPSYIHFDKTGKAREELKAAPPQKWDTNGEASTTFFEGR